MGQLGGSGIALGQVDLPLSASNGGTGSANTTFVGNRGLLGKLLGANLNVTTDQAIPIITGVTKYLIRNIVVTNASGTPTLAAGGFYTGAGKTGSTLVAAGQVYTALSAAGITLDVTLALATTSQTATTLFFALTTTNGSAVTADIYIFGDVLA